MDRKHVELGTLILALILVWLLFVFVQNPIALLINSIIAFVILLFLNRIFGLGIPINVITILIVAIGGIIGLILILILRFLNLAFYRD